MNKKVLGLLAASAAVVGSAIFAAPARAQTAVLPVEIEVTPQVFLRTYEGLKFVVSQQDLQGTGSVEQQQGNIYDEKAGTGTLSTDAPDGQSGNGTVQKIVPRLYQLWGNTGANVEIVASQNTLQDSNGATGGGGSFGGGTPSTDTVTITQVTKGTEEQKQNANNVQYREGSAAFDFTFSNPSAGSATTYTGGEITIRVVNP